jgi:DNA invertase Pin-like site-specific DNA recombinase
MSKRAVIYLRVSSVGQVNTAHDPEGYSIPGQREACQRYAEGLDAAVIREYVEPGKSAHQHQPARLTTDAWRTRRAQARLRHLL